MQNTNGKRSFASLARGFAALRAMKKSWILGLLALSQIMIPAKVWADCVLDTICHSSRPGNCDSFLETCVPNPPNVIPPCKCVFSLFACAPGDAVLVNEQFPVTGELTYDISSPARVLQSISVFNSTNIASFTLPAISGDGHSATGGVFIKADSTQLATFELVAIFTTPAYACTIEPTTTTLRINKGQKAVESLRMVPEAEHFVEIDNGGPGLNWLRIDVNGKYFRSLSLTSGGTTNIDASAAMNRDENTLTFTGEGNTGSFANITLSDSASPSAGAQETGNQVHLMFRF
jgi:hypothetical protein